MVAIDWGKQIVEIISSLSKLAGQVYCKTIDISITLEMVWELCVRWGGAVQRQSIWCAGLAGLARSSNHTHEIGRSNQMTSSSPRAA
jgi:hypothetical protein